MGFSWFQEILWKKIWFFGFFYSGTRGERLECSKRCENIINRKIIIFYIEAIPQFFFQLRKKNYRPRICFFWPKIDEQNRNFLVTKIEIFNIRKFSILNFFGCFFFEAKNFWREIWGARSGPPDPKTLKMCLICSWVMFWRWNLFLMPSVPNTSTAKFAGWVQISVIIPWQTAEPVPMSPSPLLEGGPECAGNNTD